MYIRHRSPCCGVTLHKIVLIISNLMVTQVYLNIQLQNDMFAVVASNRYIIDS